MASRLSHLGLVTVLVMISLFSISGSAQSGCMSAIISLSPCLNYITGNASTPSSSCCTQLATVVGSQPRCLCSVLNDGVPSLGIKINRTKALELPGDCKVKTPPVSRCNDVNGGSPAAAPSPGSSVSGRATTGPAAAPGPNSYGSCLHVPIFFIASAVLVLAFDLAIFSRVG